MNADPFSQVRGKFEIEESRLTARHGSKVRTGLWTVRCPRCRIAWTVQVKESGETAPPLDALLEHERRHG